MTIHLQSKNLDLKQKGKNVGKNTLQLHIESGT